MTLKNDSHRCDRFLFDVLKRNLQRDILLLLGETQAALNPLWIIRSPDDVVERHVEEISEGDCFNSVGSISPVSYF